jgi:hypothetical protein
MQRPPLQTSARSAQHCAPVVQVRPVSGMHMSPQATKPVLHAYWQTPPVHVAVALARLQGVHDVPQAATELVPA